MYPFLRLINAMAKAGRQPQLGLFDTHKSRVMCWPWDLDPWVELNNGRTLTLYDLGRVPLSRRIGLERLLSERRWRLTVAGSSIRYRRRVKLFARLTLFSRCLGWDDRFIYTDQSMWDEDDCTSQVLIRSAILSKGGMVPPREMAVALGVSPESPALPAWVQAWIHAEATRPWPPAR